MNISKSTWHYRLLSKMDMLNNYGTESLCPYFWKMVFATIIAPVILLGLLFLTTIPLWWSFSGVPVSLAIIIGVAEIVGLFSLLVALVRDRYEEEIRAGTRQEPVVRVYTSKPPSLFRLWLKAKHRQVCPLIDFVDD